MKNQKNILSKLMWKWLKICLVCRKYTTFFLITVQTLKQTKRNIWTRKLNRCLSLISVKDSSLTVCNFLTRSTNCPKPTNCPSKTDSPLTSHAVSKCNYRNNMTWLWHLLILIQIMICTTSIETKWTQLKWRSGRQTSRHRQETRTTRKQWSKCGRHSPKYVWMDLTSSKKRGISTWRCSSTRMFSILNRTWPVSCSC